MIIRAFHPFFYLLIHTVRHPCVHLSIFSFFLPPNIYFVFALCQVNF